MVNVVQKLAKKKSTNSSEQKEGILSRFNPIYFDMNISVLDQISILWCYLKGPLLGEESWEYPQHHDLRCRARHGKAVYRVHHQWSYSECHRNRLYKNNKGEFVRQRNQWIHAKGIYWINCKSTFIHIWKPFARA